MAGGVGGNIDQQRVNVVVFGAGITGLTVAQELAERRFKVWVVEPTFDVNRHGQWALAIGGMARTQYAAVNESATAANVMSPSHFPLARVAMHAPLSESDPAKPRPIEKVPPHVMEYFRRLEEPHLYGNHTHLRFLYPESSRILERVEKCLGIRGWMKGKHWTPEPLKVKKVRAGSVKLVRRARRVEISYSEGQLSRVGSRVLREFLDSTSPGDAVSLVPGVGDHPPPSALRTILEAHYLTVPTDSIVRQTTREQRLGTSILEKQLEEETIFFNSQGVLTAEGVALLRKFQADLVSGDVIEIHHPDFDPKGAVKKAVTSIRKELSNAGVMALVASLDASMIVEAPYQSTHCLLPGEHGFRFFPSYYRHLRNTLRRIPTFEFDDRRIPQLTKRQSGETVLDNLVNTPVQALAGSGTNPLLYPRAPTPSVGAIAHQLKSVLLERGYDPRDIGQFIIRVVRYMSTGSKRRELELDRISWWQYLRGYDPMTGTYRFRYSDEFTRDLSESPRVLAAFDAEWGDAHTNGNTFVQLLLNQFLQTEDVDQVLNAPTSEAWFEHWEQYLREQLEVRFVSARLRQLDTVGPPGSSSRIRATVRSMTNNQDRKVRLGDATNVIDPDLAELNSALSGNGPKYYVLATDAATAERLTSKLPPGMRVGVAKEIQGFERVVRGSPLGEEPPQPRPDLKYGYQPWDRFQTLTGVQFFFRNVTGIFDGHVYYMGAPWALSSINQQLFWRISLISRFAPYRGLLSADIGRFTDAWALKQPQKIAENTWEQIRNALRVYWESDRVDERLKLIAPTWFHIDSTINLQKDVNNSPYLIPIVDDWQNRPIDVLFDPAEGLDSPVPDLDDPDRLSWAPWGGYRVHWGEWLFAGTYMRHFTRMTTMEAANESGRHAVNAILDNFSVTAKMTLPPDFAPRRRYSTAGNPLEPRTAYVPTPLGDYCHIWDMENYELADLVQLRELDDWLVDQGLPHVCDLVGGEIIPSMVSYLPSASELGLPTAADIIRALTPPFEASGVQWPFGGLNVPGLGSWPWPK